MKVIKMSKNKGGRPNYFCPNRHEKENIASEC